MRVWPWLFAAMLPSFVLGAGPKRYRSPDGSLVATVMSEKQRKPYGIDTSRIEIRDRKGRLVAERDHSIFPNQGLAVVQAGWTKDSRFFVYSTEESGGHQPWRWPTFFYSRNRDRFYSLEVALRQTDSPGVAITGSIELRPPSLVLTQAKYSGKSRRGLRVGSEIGGDSGDYKLSIDLRRLERHLTPASLSTDAMDREELRRERTE